MDILRFAGGRMKITLTEEEFSACRGKRDGRSGEDAGELIGRVYKEIERRTGIRISAGGKVELYPVKGGGCEVFVERDGGEDAQRSARRVCIFDERARAGQVREALISCGESVRLFYDEKSGKTLLLSTSSGRSEHFLREFGVCLPVDPLPYLREHAKEIDT